jgi:2,4-dienoyl-CoA reductase (NADPH2)
VVQAWDVLRNKAETGKNVVVVGRRGSRGGNSHLFGGNGHDGSGVLRFLLLYAAETPETLRYHLNHGSKRIAVVEMLKSIGKDIGKTTRWIMQARLKSMDIALYTLSRVVEIRKAGVVVEGPGGIELIPADTVVLAVALNQIANCLPSLRMNSGRFFVIGDADTPRKAMDAIRAGYDLAATL